MSSNQGVPPPSVGSFLPPPGTNFIAVIDSAIPFLMIGAAMGAILVVMLMALLFFSTTSMRRKPIFILNVIAILAGIVDAAVNVYEEIHTMKFPLVPMNPQVIIFMGTLNGITPTLVDSILLLRLYAVFPPHTTPRIKFAAIMGPAVLVKIARLINASIYMANYSRNVNALANTRTGVGGAMVLVTSPLPNVKIEWFLQVFDDIYSSTIFLYHVYRQSAPSRQDREQTFSQKMNTFFWISTSNFVFPVMLGIVQIVIYMAKPNDYLLALYVEEVNFQFTIIGVVFATVWMAEGRWADDHHIRDPSIHVLSSIRFTASPREPTQQRISDKVFTPSPENEIYEASSATSDAVDRPSSDDKDMSQAGRNWEKELP